MKNENHSDGQSGSDPAPNALSLQNLNKRHLSTIDKWYRMCAGAGSEITGFERGTIYLAITVDERKQPPFDEIAYKIARSWLHEEELKKASQYVAVIFQTDGRLGALVSSSKKAPDQLAHEVLKMMRPVTRPEVPITVIQGRFGNGSS